MKRQVFQNSVLREEWDTDTRVYTSWNAAGQQVSQRAFTAAESVRADVEIAAAVAAANVDSRTAKLQTAKARMQQIVTLASTPAARTATAWTQPQRVAILDAVQDMARALSWLADQELQATDTPDA